MNLFLEAAETHNKILNVIDLKGKQEKTSVLESKLITGNKFSKRVAIDLVNYAETLEEKEKMNDLIEILEKMDNEHKITSHMMTVLKSIPSSFLLKEELKPFWLSKEDYMDSFSNLATRTVGFTVYSEKNERNIFYNTDIQTILAKAFYYIHLKQVKDIPYSLLITPHRTKKLTEYEFMFLYYKHFTHILKNYFDTEFELTMENFDDIQKLKIENVKSLIQINKSISLEESSLIYKRLDELNIGFELIQKLVNQYLYIKKANLHDLYIETIESNIKLIDGFDGSYEDYLMTYELVKANVDFDNLNTNRYKDVRNYFIENSVYNAMYKDKFIYYLSNEEEIELNISEQMQQLNNIMKNLKEKELDALNKDNKEDKENISNIILLLSNLTPKKSKVFLRLLNEKIEDFTNYNSLLFNPVVFETLQLNMLNEKTMDLYLESNASHYKKALESMSFETKMAPEFLYEIIQYTFKYKLSNLLVEKGIKQDIIIRILKSFRIILKGSNVIKEDDYLNLISEMSVKEINELYKATTNKKDISRENVFSLYLLEKMHKIFKEVENDNQLRFILRNDDNIQDNLNEMLEKELASKKEYKQFQNKLNATELFFEKHKSSLLNFLYDDKHRLALTYAKDMPAQQANNVFLLAKADIAGMLHEVKFSKIEQELEMALLDERKDLWKKQLSLDFNRFNVKEVVDFRTLMELGENPTRSCMNYATGQYRRCLLSIFDSTKQYVGVYDNGKLVARAILRLTKTTTAAKNNVLGFEDVENLASNSFEDTKKNEEPILFLERMYSNYNSNQKIEMQNIIVKLVQEKAKAMGVKAIAASSYINGTTCKENDNEMKVFITHSQNGNQYLDSFGGQETENSGGVYKTASKYGIIHEI